MVIVKAFWIIGSLIFTVLGTLHLAGILFTDKFLPDNKKLIDDLKLASTNLSKHTNMWSGWIGFNTSHSTGLMFIGIANIYLSVNYFTLMQTDNMFFIFNILTVGFYVWIAKKYWFKIPQTGIIITFICFIISYILTIINR